MAAYRWIDEYKLLVPGGDAGSDRCISDSFEVISEGVFWAACPVVSRSGARKQLKMTLKMLKSALVCAFLYAVLSAM
jgi:hypothetical protein